MSGRVTKELPRSKRRYQFALTPLADAMFQLLIFFMLTSSLTPYSILVVKPGAGSKDSAATTGAALQNQNTTPAVTWTIENNELIANGQRFDFEALPSLAASLNAANTERVVLISSPKARVQDMVRVVEVLNIARIPAVQLVALEEG